MNEKEIKQAIRNEMERIKKLKYPGTRKEQASQRRHEKEQARGYILWRAEHEKFIEWIRIYICSENPVGYFSDLGKVHGFKFQNISRHDMRDAECEQRRAISAERGETWVGDISLNEE